MPTSSSTRIVCSSLLLRRTCFHAGIYSAIFSIAALFKVAIHSIESRSKCKTFATILQNYNEGHYASNDTDEGFLKYKSILMDNDGKRILQLMKYSISLHSVHLIVVLVATMTSWQVVRSCMYSPTMRSRHNQRERVARVIAENQEYSRYHLGAWLVVVLPALCFTAFEQIFDYYRCMVCQSTFEFYVNIIVWTLYIISQIACIKPVFLYYQYLRDLIQHQTTEQVITEIYNITHDDLYGQENTHQTDLENVQINLTPPAYNDEYSEGYKWTYTGADLPREPPPAYTLNHLEPISSGQAVSVTSTVTSV